MIDHYTRRGRRTGQEYLIVVDNVGLTLFDPSDWRWSLGLCWYPAAGKRMGPGWVGHIHALDYISRRERRLARAARRSAHRHRFATNRRGAEATS